MAGGALVRCDLLPASFGEGWARLTAVGDLGRFLTPSFEVSIPPTTIEMPVIVPPTELDEVEDDELVGITTPFAADAEEMSLVLIVMLGDDKDEVEEENEAKPLPSKIGF